jgi:trk system potassium uptake protein TrkH
MNVRNKPYTKLLLSFIFVILIGSLLLFLPISAHNISYIDALFTSASAVCVTGLSVIDVSTSLTVFGKVILLILIQIGGLGLMTFIGVIILSLRSKISFSNQSLLQYSFLQKTPNFSIKKFVIFLFKYTFIVEGVGALLLILSSRDANFSNRIFYSIFHSISAFCNAGFSLYTDGLVRYHDNTTYSLTISFLIITGGIGFLVVFEIISAIKNKIFKHNTFYNKFLSLNSWIVINVTILLLLIGTFIFYIIEPITFLEAFFQSVTTRTAGFNTIELSTLSHESKFVTMFLMLIGGSPGSTAGGMKTTTFALLFLIAFMAKNNFKDITIRKRRISNDIVYQALIIFLLYIIFLSISIFILLYLHPDLYFLDVIFEAISAIGTVGLTLGVTTKLIFSSKIVIIFMMFIGRVGPVLIFSILVGSDKRNIKYVEEKILIG